MTYLRELNIGDKQKVIELCEEIRKYDNNFEGLDNFGRMNEYEEFLKKCDDGKYQDRIKPNYSTQTVYCLFDDDELIGGLILRHEIKGNLINHGGNIGYLIRPTKRNIGYATVMLKLALEKCKELNLDKVLITCRDENVASSKVIKNNGGIYENDYYDEESNTTYKRYWIYL